jgi:lysozyme
VRRGQSFTEDECRDLLSADVGQTWTAIAPCINEPTSDNERGAFVSFSFNVGAANFCGSTIVKKLNAGDHAGACAELSRWVFAGGKQMSGLVRRRAAERALCEGKD